MLPTLLRYMYHKHYFKGGGWVFQFNKGDGEPNSVTSWSGVAKTTDFA